MYKTILKHIREHLLQSFQLEQTHKNMPSLSELKRTEWSEEFETLMRNRLLMGAFRYGRLNAPGKPTFDSIGSIKKRIKSYKETGNTEHLVDIANLCLVEFVEGKHPWKHFKSMDDGDHSKEI